MTVIEPKTCPIDITSINLEKHPAFQKAIQMASSFSIDDRDIGAIDIVNERGCIMYAVRGPVGAHENMDYWPRSHIIVLKASEAMFQMETWTENEITQNDTKRAPKVALTPGTVMIFNGQQTHWVDQPENQLLVWLSVKDLPSKMTLAETIETAETIESAQDQLNWAELNSQHLVPKSPMALIASGHSSKA